MESSQPVKQKSPEGKTLNNTDLNQVADQRFS